jgi:MFS family permease
MVRSRLRAAAPPAVVAKFYAYRATATWHFVAPILVVFQLEQGLSYTQVSVLGAAFSLGLVFGEIPTGYVADRLGRRESLVVGQTMVLASVVAFGFTSSFWPFLAEEVVWTLGITLQSGSRDAWLYDVLADRGVEGEFARVTGRASAINAVVAAVSTVLGGYLFEVDHTYPFLATGGVMAVGAAVLLTLPAAGDGGDDEDAFRVLEAAQVVRDRLLAPELRGFLLFVSLLAAVVSVLGLFVQPIVVNLGFSESWLGWIFGAATAAGAVVSYAAGDIEERVGIRRWFRTSAVLVGVVVAAVAALPLLVIPVFVLARGWNRATIPLRNHFVNDRVGGRGRATVLSAVSMVFFGVEAAVEVTAGAIADYASPEVAVGVTGVAVLVAAAAAWVSRALGVGVAGTPSGATGDG